jgi:hypothetical protein
MDGFGQLGNPPSLIFLGQVDPGFLKRIAGAA